MVLNAKATQYTCNPSGNDSGDSIAVDHCGTACGPSADSYRILVTGYLTNSLLLPDNSEITTLDMIIWRYTDAGILDTTFGDIDGAQRKGYATYPNIIGDAFWPSAIFVDISGNILVAGNSVNSFWPDMTLWLPRSVRYKHEL